jgi:peptidoglycan-associated lipoprotein
MKDEYMKRNKFVSLLVIGLALTVAASGCRKKPVNTTVLPGAPTGSPRDDDRAKQIKPGEPPIVTTDVPYTASPQGTGHPGWGEDAIVLKPHTVYFDYDSSVLKTAEKPKVSAVADYLKANSGKAVRIEGNCDERGTEEYNRALGERRALAVREELIRLGIDPKDADTISYGKDRPAAQGHNEAAWKQNRRDDFILLSPPK